MKHPTRWNPLYASVLIALSCILCGCSNYLWKVAVEQGKILARREPIPLVIEDPRTPPANREKLRLVQRVRAFTETLGLNPRRSFTLYASTDREPLLWVLVGARPEAFVLAQWNFPIVGSVPYKGFFERTDAVQEGETLKRQGFEISIRGSSAFSTLGWFNDPILTNLLQRDDLEVINTVIHEVVHTTLWIPGSVQFNESLANFVGHEGARLYALDRRTRCGEDRECLARYESLSSAAAADLEREVYLSREISALYAELDALYARTELTNEEKLRLRQPIFDSSVRRIRATVPNFPLLRQPNNAELIQLYLYLHNLDRFRELYQLLGSDMRVFMDEIRTLSATRDGEPFEVLLSRIYELRDRTASS